MSPDHDKSRRDDNPAIDGGAHSRAAAESRGTSSAGPVNGSDDQGEGTDGSSTTESRLDVLSLERNSLRSQVEGLRRSLDEIQATHLEELETVRNELEESRGEREQAETQYQTLLGKVNTIKSQLGERLKADRVGGLVIH